jgi:hypothetical protein
VGAKPVDHGTLLVPLGSADIFFPTDFDLLCRLYRESAATAAAARGARPPAVTARHTPSREFFIRLADLRATATLSGYNPLLEDFANTRFFVGSVEPSTAVAQGRNRRRGMM